MTSNLTETQLHDVMRPEFLNRIDEIIDFTPLSKDDIRRIVSLQLNHVEQLLTNTDSSNKGEPLLTTTPEAIDFLVEVGYDPYFGARPVKRAIQRYLLDVLSKEIIAGNIKKGEKVKVDVGEGGLKVSRVS